MALSTIEKRLGQALRRYYDDIAKEPLPERWAQLIKCLNDKVQATPPAKRPTSKFKLKDTAPF